MMELLAFRVGEEDGDKILGRLHALDLCTIVAWQVESAYQESHRLDKLYGGDRHVEMACGMTGATLPMLVSIGVICLREHLFFPLKFPVPDFFTVLCEIVHV